ncbi:hypothetical protein E0H35_36515 [Rhizobium leguminosarum bv. viciae]|uniref:hypothetical protein n=1 Tax=Rhizobium TaxID=379 RepID=UPI000CE2A1EA|nr:MULTISPECIES: hypothetical protein [Rhizobium]AVC52693.1 hypothetical protein RLV_2224 [Rhizobium leguminosarum bv. viciae]MBB4345665.1 hypothetical protein [Rhizobium leguminosarum]MBB6298736.1 hypothetical protein [Rhizobium leguminosarum]MBX5069019.1 hypothetical protein [Rhizobium lentis]MBY5345656.1 hypothetical protein [Rhizobium leguminosarum]
MNTIGTFQLEPNRFYWVRRMPAKGASISEPSDIEVVQISTVFGAACEFWTVAVVGSDERFDLSAFEFFRKVPSPPIAGGRRANLVRGADSVAAFRRRA